MICEQLSQLYQLCKDSDVQIPSSDLVRIACSKCKSVEVCPSITWHEYEARQK